MAFDNEKDYDYIFKILHNQEIFWNFKIWMNFELEKEVSRLQKKLLLLDSSLTITKKTEQNNKIAHGTENLHTPTNGIQRLSNDYKLSSSLVTNTAEKSTRETGNTVWKKL